MFRIILVLAVFLFTTSESFSKRYLFSYDACGNRTNRSFSISKIGAEPESDELKQQFNDCTVSIYPNPTDRILNIKIDKLSANASTKAELVDIKGNAVKQLDKLNPENQFDLSKLTNGVYILSIEIDGKKTSWKVVKQN